LRLSVALFHAVWLPQFAAGTSPAGDWVRVYTCAQGETDLTGRCKRLRDSFFSPFHASGLLVAVSLRLDFVLF
jgi:hypothetical protein